MYAIVKDRGHQYKVEEGGVIRVARLDQEEGSVVTFDHVLLLGKDSDVQVGTPEIAGARVTGVLEQQFKDKKVIAMRRIKTNSLKTRQGHRTQYSMVKIEKIEG